MVLNSFSFCLSVKLFISPSYLNEIFAGYSNLGCRFFSFITLSMPCHSLWYEEFLLTDQLLSLWGSPCVLFVAFHLLLLIFICSLCLIFSILLIYVLWCFTLGLYCLDSLHFLDLGCYFFPHFREVFNYYLLKYFLMTFLFVFFF